LSRWIPSFIGNAGISYISLLRVEILVGLEAVKEVLELG